MLAVELKVPLIMLLLRDKKVGLSIEIELQAIFVWVFKSALGIPPM